METATQGPNAIVNELLTSSSSTDDYLNWKFMLKNYLLGEGLWDITSGINEFEGATQAEFSTWRMKNIKALHAIQIACSPDVLPLIRQMMSANVAWNYLASIYKKSNINVNVEQILASVQVTTASESAIVSEPLIISENYLKWRSLMNDYFVEQGLTVVVSRKHFKAEITLADFHSWMMLNEKALDAIRISCGLEMLSIVKEVDSANAAWDLLGFVYLKQQAFITAPADIPIWREKLMKAIKESDWESMKSIIDHHPQVLRERLILETGDTLLHLVLNNPNSKILSKLVDIMSSEELEQKNETGTALTHAATVGNVEDAKVLVRKNAGLLVIKSNLGELPVVSAARKGNRETLQYLYSITPENVLMSSDISINAASLLTLSIAADIYDVPLQILHSNPQLALARDLNGNTVFIELARKHLSFPGGTKPSGFGQRWIYSRLMETQDWREIHGQTSKIMKLICPQLANMNNTQLSDAKLPIAALLAVKYGSVSYLREIFSSAPILEQAFMIDDHRSYLHEAILSRQAKSMYMLSMMRSSTAMLSLVDKCGYNLLHYAALLPVSASLLGRASGAALQMQLELQWFQEVEKLVQPSYKEMTNNRGQTPKELFREQHRDLAKEGEKWMKDTSQACMVVSTLIATVMFAAAFTVPGGNIQDKGTPIFLKEKAFAVFIVSDGISLFSSLTSVLMFLAILTSRYAEEDFIRSLPQKLILGLASLFISIVTMLAAFAATLFIVLHERIWWVLIPVTFIAAVPVSLFAFLQFPLFLDMVFSTYTSRVFSKASKVADQRKKRHIKSN